MTADGLDFDQLPRTGERDSFSTRSSRNWRRGFCQRVINRLATGQHPSGSSGQRTGLQALILWPTASPGCSTKSCGRDVYAHSFCSDSHSVFALVERHLADFAEAGTVAVQRAEMPPVHALAAITELVKH